MPRFTQLAIDNADDLLFGTAPKPLTTRSGMTLGGGQVYPEINFTLPTMTVDESTMPTAVDHYRRIIAEVLKRAGELGAPGVVVEFETVPPLTEHPDWGMEIVKILLDGMAAEADASGLKSVLRMTPNDNREFERPPVMRSGYWLDNMLELFERSAEAGAELLSIESVGGKEIHDEALQFGDLGQVIFSQCVMGCRDMTWLWTKLSDIAAKHNVHAAGDTACGFANTAMVLAEQKMIPHVFAAVVRAVSAVRTLVAYECGAVGPGKDCGYENIICKAITGFPMAHEGKTAACAHLSPVGNVAAAACDTWSNESVQHIKLLGGMAPTCSMESLVYDCRLFNTAASGGAADTRRLRDWLVASDVGLDPQALVLSPGAAVAIGRAIVEAPNHYQSGIAAARTAITICREAHEAGTLQLNDRETPWLDMMDQSLDALPADESAFIDQMMAVVDTTKFLPAEYGL